MKNLIIVGTLILGTLFTGCGYKKINYVEIEKDTYIICTDKQIIEQNISKDKIVLTEYLNEREYKFTTEDDIPFDYIILKYPIVCKDSSKQWQEWNRLLDSLSKDFFKDDE